MSAKTEPTSKKFGKGSRTVPHHSEKAQKWYPADDAPANKKVSRKHAHIHEHTTTGRDDTRNCDWKGATGQWDLLGEIWADMCEPDRAPNMAH